MNTWKLPKTNSEIRKAIKLKKKLYQIKTQAYQIFGDDIFFDAMENAFNRIGDVIKLVQGNLHCCWYDLPKEKK